MVFARDNDFWKNVERPIVQDVFGVSAQGSVFLSFLAISELRGALLGFNGYFGIWGGRFCVSSQICP